MTGRALLTVPAGIGGRLKADPMLRNSAFIMATTIVTSLLGYVFWLMVARDFAPQVSGRGSATTSALQAAALFASVGSAAAMIEWLPKTSTERHWRQKVTAGLVVAVGASAVGALAVIIVLGHLVNLLPELAGTGGALLFGLGAVFFAVGTLFDYVAVSQRRGGVMLARNLVFTGLRIPLLLLPPPLLGSTDPILASWAVAAGGSLLVDVAAFGFGRSRRSLWPTWGRVRADLRQMAASLVGQHFVTIAAMMTTYLQIGRAHV